MRGGLPVSPDGCVHTTFKHDPSTLRLSSAAPNMQNIPRGPLIKSLFVAPPGYTFWSQDYAGIEALLVGFFARSERYQRLARLDIHSFYLAHVLEAEGIILAADVPAESTSDSELQGRLSAIKAQYGKRRTGIKPLVHGGNYLMGPSEAQDVMLKGQHTVTPLKQIKRLQAFYWELFPEIPRWHERVTGKWANGAGVPDPTEQENAYQRTWLRTPFGNWHQYYDVLRWQKRPTGWEAQYSADAKRAIAFLPQSCGRFILTRAAQRLPSAVQDTLRLLIHDEMLGLCRLEDVEGCLQASQLEMERPVPELGGLVVKTVAKVGRCWGEMTTVA